MTIQVRIRNLGSHGRLSQAPKELEGFLKEFFLVLLGRQFTLDVIVENKRLEPRGKDVIRALRIERNALVVRCWPNSDASIGGRTCHIHFDRSVDPSIVYNQLVELVDEQGLTKENLAIFLKNGQIRTVLDEFWTEEKLTELTAAMLANKTRSRNSVDSFNMARSLARIIGVDVKNSGEIERHINFLRNKQWLAIRTFGNRRDMILLDPGKAMIRQVAIHTGALDPDNCSDEAFNDYVEKNQFITKELQQAINSLTNAKNRLPHLLKTRDRLKEQYEQAELEVMDVESTIKQAQNNILAAKELRVSEHPFISQILEEHGIKLDEL